jgi:hypothetical protein
METIYQNAWCKILLKGTIYVLHSKSDKYNDQYFTTLDAAYMAIGINRSAQKFN